MSWTQFRSSDKLAKVLLVASGAHFQQLKLQLKSWSGSCTVRKGKRM